MISNLRPYQAQAVSDLRDTLRQGVLRPVLQAATGAGKTKIAAAIVDSAMSKGKRIAFVVPSISLIDQTVESFWDEGIRDIGVIQAYHPMTDWSRKVQVCSIQTVACREFYPEADIVLIDECHRLFTEHAKWMAEKKGKPFIGLSATPWTKGLGKHFETLLVAARTKDLIEQGYLSPFRCFATGHPDLSKVKTLAGDYHEGQLSTAMQAGSLIADIIGTWQALWGQDKTLCFAVDRAHARALQKRFQQAGISCGYQDAKTPDDERREIKKMFHNGGFRVVVNIGTLTTGVDWDVRCLILARPTKSEILYTQIIGRALRTAPGKKDALILDHSDTTANLGFVTDIHHDTLDDGKPKPKVDKNDKPLPKPCPKCGMLRPPGPVCANCGFKAEVVNRTFESPGSLVEITPGKVQTPTKTIGQGATMAEKSAFLSELKNYAIAKGYQPGYAANQFRAKFGVWPDHSIENVQPAAEISPATKSWIRHRQIAWAHSKKREAARG